jgi:GTPase
MPPLLAIVGRPNVGKSTLFNRLIGKRLAIIAKEAGTTRDRVYQDFQVNDLGVTLVDTGGIECGKQENIESDIQTQAKIAIQEADMILFVVDSVEELTVDDFSAADILRKSKKPVILVANKCDKREEGEAPFNIYELGFGDPVYISAIHKLGIDELKSITEEKLKEAGVKIAKKNTALQKRHETINLCFLGRPNVGKSSLVNKLLGEDKVIVSNIPGTTRDTTDTRVDFEEQKFNLIDTAGIRRRGKVETGIEYFSVLRSLGAIERSDMVALIIDGEEGLRSQDAHIASYILDKRKGLFIVVNKWDLKEKGEKEQIRFISRMQRRLAFLPWAPVLFTSAKTGKNVHKIFDIAKEIFAERQRELETEELQLYIEKISLKHLPTGLAKKRPKIVEITQNGINPPTFVFKAKHADAIHFSYKRYLENKIRERYGFNGTPIKMIFQK